MEVKSQHKTAAIQEVQYSQSLSQKEKPEIDMLQVITETNKFSAGYDEVVTGLERSDSFLQRVSAINGEIVRQLTNK